MLEAQSLSVNVEAIQVCKDFSMQIAPGEICGILGQNGAGKTTLLTTLSGLRTATTGDVAFEGKSLRDYNHRVRAQKIGVLFQNSAQTFPATVLATVLVGRHPHIDRWQWESRRDLEIARDALRTVGLHDYENRPLDTLSGGERRRLDIAVLLAQQTSVLLLDEPFNHLDLRYQVALLDVFKHLAKQQQKTLVMVLHDINIAQRICDRVILLYGEGEIAQGSAQELLTAENLSAVYQCAVHAHVDQNGRRVFTVGD